jgi:hypothetical protein
VKLYGNRAGNSGVQAYETGRDFIVVKFAGRRKPYLYTGHSTSAANIRKMKELAKSGEGLSTFISQVVKDGYERE